MSEYSVTPRLIEEPQERDRIVPAGFFVRLMARALDVIIIIAVINLFYYIDTFGGTRGWWPPMPIPGETLPTADTFMSTVNKHPPGNLLHGYSSPVLHHTARHGRTDPGEDGLQVESG